MIIGIPVDKSTIEGNISDHFGRTEFFLIWNTENEESKFIVNDAINAQGGAGIKSAQLLVDNDVDAIISPRLGQNAFEVIDCADIKIYEPNGKSIEKNITALKEGKLSPLNDIHEGFHGHGGN
jgi:predicted Fe-Mo cluster-binding NifX family protein